jgi:hypothetical protein
MIFEEHKAVLAYNRVEAWIRVYAGIVHLLNKTEPSAVVELLQSCRRPEILA